MNFYEAERRATSYVTMSLLDTKNLTTKFTLEDEFL